ncbi:MAG: hypothetical protein WEA34_07160 [Gemmatimonadota bacterium]
MTAKTFYGIALLVTLFSFFLVPGTAVQASSCSEIGGSACTMKCFGFSIWKKCQYTSYWGLI